MSLWESIEGGGIRFGTPQERSSPLTYLGHGPPYPGTSVVEPAVIPAPPLLADDIPEQSQAFQLLCSYQGACTSRYGRRVYVTGGLDFERSPRYSLLVKAAKKLIEHRLPPAAWAAWSVDLWRGRQGKPNPQLPPINFVFGSTRIDKHRGWFRSEASSYVGGQAIYGPKHRELLRCWTNMAMELIRLESSADALAVVQKHFPGGRWNELVLEARAEAEVTASLLEERLRRGDWLWR